MTPQFYNKGKQVWVKFNHKGQHYNLPADEAMAILATFGLIFITILLLAFIASNEKN